MSILSEGVPKVYAIRVHVFAAPKRDDRLKGSAKSGAVAQPIALQLRFLQTMREISSEHKTTTIPPLSIKLFASLINRSESQTPKEP